MKTRKYFLVAILPLILLVSCYQNETLVKQNNNDTLVEQDNSDTMDQQDNNNKSLEEFLDVKYNYTITGNTSDEFPILISDNPIDLKHKELLEDYDGSSRMISEIGLKYKDWWYTEMEVAYNQLLKLLDEKDRQSLINSQISWESYMENKKQIEESFFYQHKYDTVGTLRTALTIAEEAEETKERAYSLLEYLYIITGEINLVFSPEE
jgi:hypothetical protein